MKSYMMHECGNTSRSQKDIYACKAAHYDLTLRK